MSGEPTGRAMTRDPGNRGSDTSSALRPEPGASADLTGAASIVDTRSSRDTVSTGVDNYVPPAVGPTDLAERPGPFNDTQLSRLDEAVTLGSRETGLLFSVYVGSLAAPVRATVESLAARLPLDEYRGAVLLAVSPGQRMLQIVTTGTAAARLPNRTCALAALGMRAAFAGGDLTAGLVNGIRLLADAAGADVGRV
ncbi:MAG: DUF5130 family protein [bacterium]